MADLGNEITNSLSRTGEGGMLVPFQNIDGAVATPGITWRNETVTGFYRAGINDMRVSVGAVDKFRWTASSVQVWDGATWLNVATGGDLGDYLPLAGGTVTGQIKGITPVAAEDLVRKDYVDALESGIISFNGRTEENAIPTAGDYDATQVDYSAGLTPNWTATEVQTALESAYNDIQFLAGAVVLRGVWDANLNSPDLIAESKVNGNYWIVTVEGSTVLPLYPGAPAFDLPYEVEDRILWLDDGVDSGFAQLRDEASDFLPLSGGTMLGDIIGSNALSFNTVTSNADAGNIGKEILPAIADCNLIAKAGFYNADSSLNSPDGLAFGSLMHSAINATSAAQFYMSRQAVSPSVYTRAITTGGGAGEWFELFASDTRTSAEANTILDNTDAGNIGKTTFDIETDLDLVEESGFTRGSGITLNMPPTVSAATIVTTAYDGNYANQLLMSNTDTAFFRRKGGGVWNAWVEIAKVDSVVDLTTAQNIGGAKAFTQNINMTAVQANQADALTRKDYVDSVFASGVTSFNSRTGAVLPLASDYDAIQVDYDNALTPAWGVTEVQSALVDAYDAIQFLAGAVVLKGTWDALNNIPDLVAIGKTSGNYWIVSVEGSTVLPKWPDAPAFELPYEINDRILWLDDGVDSGFAQLRPDVGEYLLLTGGSMLGDIIGSNGLSYNTVTSDANYSGVGKLESDTVTDLDLINRTSVKTYSSSAIGTPSGQTGVLITSARNSGATIQTAIDAQNKFFWRSQWASGYVGWSEVPTKDYVDSLDGDNVKIEGAQDINGTKTFKAANTLLENDGITLSELGFRRADTGITPFGFRFRPDLNQLQLLTRDALNTTVQCFAVRVDDLRFIFSENYGVEWAAVPTSSDHLVNKAYADTKLSLSGGTLTGTGEVLRILDPINTGFGSVIGFDMSGTDGVFGRVGTIAGTSSFYIESKITSLELTGQTEINLNAPAVNVDGALNVDNGAGQTVVITNPIGSAVLGFNSGGSWAGVLGMDSAGNFYIAPASNQADRIHTFYSNGNAEHKGDVTAFLGLPNEISMSDLSSAAKMQAGGLTVTDAPTLVTLATPYPDLNYSIVVTPQSGLPDPSLLLVVEKLTVSTFTIEMVSSGSTACSWITTPYTQ